MSSLVVARRDRKLAAFKDAISVWLSDDILNIISRFVAEMTVCVHPEPLLEDHSIALSSRGRRGKIHISLFKATDSLFGTRPRYLWGGFLPAVGSDGEAAHVLYTTGHGFVISITRGSEGSAVIVTAISQKEEEPIFNGDSCLYCFNGALYSCYSSSQRVDVFDGFYVMLDRV